MENLPFIYYLGSFFIFFSGVKLSLAADTISPGGFIEDGGDTLVSLEERFELGFFSPGNSTNRYLGIWYKISPDKVVWVANRNNPIPNTNGVLSISNGSLVLNSTTGIIWSPNVSTKVENPVARLLDTGNFVLVRDNFSSNPSDRLWQSFDFPTDVLLPGMRLGWNLKTGLERYLTSWRSPDDPSPGDATFRFNIDVLPQMVTYRESVKITRTGPWNGVFFGAIPTQPNWSKQPNLLFVPVMEHNQDEYSCIYETTTSEILMLLKVNQSGVLLGQVWNKRSNGWASMYSAPEDSCGYYGHCGSNTLCSFNQTADCECLKGFIPKSQNNQSRGCVRSSQLDCEPGDGFVKVDGIKLPDLVNVLLNESIVFNDCEDQCKKNCSCRAYANSNLTQGGTGCLMWFGDIIDLRKVPENRGAQDVYIRVPAPEPDPEDKGNKGNRREIWITVIVLVILTIIISGLILTYKMRKLRRKGEDLLLFDLGMNLEDQSELSKVEGKGGRKEVKLPLFSFASVSAATDNFSAKNMLGEGGFGRVYKGTLLKGDEIAIKRLSKKSGQGWEEFKNEAVLIAKLQHKNLVRVLGCCIDQDEKILIYEYMPNKSLDIVLFDPERSKLLDWGTRVRIIEGVSQGLLYLHTYSRLRIIHRDLKASNILLDKDMNPKISDFGLAKIFGVNELQANTNRIVGTYGYMSPEYALQGIVSLKSDVFSFGVLLLEIISGKKNTGFYQTNSLNLLGYAWDMWVSDRGLDLMDPVLDDASCKDSLLRYINISLLCVQERPEDRPSISEVVSMLSNESAPLPSPEQPAFSHLRSLPISNEVNCSVNEITESVVEAR